MSRRRIIQRGDVYWIDPNPITGREVKDRHRFVVITPKEINQLGISMTVPITSQGQFPRAMGLTVPIMNHDTTGVALCHHICSFDIDARIKIGAAQYIEQLDMHTMSEIISRVLSVIDPAEEQ